MFQKFVQNLTLWLLDHGVKIAAIIIAAYLIRRFAVIFIEKIIRKTIQWDVAGELRKRLKIAFDKEGIEIPFPQRVIHSANKS
ncbi:MAG: hypothetical protein Q8Q17_02590 [bacterium]|nr:hypothetical protein [bacterium]